MRACKWPNTPQSLKGVSGDVIILEEAAYCDPGLVSEVVVPLLSMQSSVLLCISTILDSGNRVFCLEPLTPVPRLTARRTRAAQTIPK